MLSLTLQVCRFLLERFLADVADHEELQESHLPLLGCGQVMLQSVYLQGARSRRLLVAKLNSSWPSHRWQPACGSR